MPAYAHYLTEDEAIQLHHLWELERIIIKERKKIIDKADSRRWRRRAAIKRTIEAQDEGNQKTPE